MAGFAYIIKDIYKVILPLLICLLLNGASVDTYKKELESVEKEIKKNETLIRNASRKENVTLSDIEQIEHELEKSRKEKSRHDRELRQLNASMGKMGTQIKELEEQFISMKDSVRIALERWYSLKNTQRSYSAFLAYDYSENILKYEIMRRLNEKNREFVNALIQKKKDLANKNREYSIRSNQIQKVKRLVELKSSNIEKEKKLKDTYLKKLKAEKDSYRNYLVNLEKKKSGINKKIKELIRQEMEKRKKLEAQKVVDNSKSAVDRAISGYRDRLNVRIEGKVISSFGRSVNKEFGISINNDGIEVQQESRDLFSPIEGTVIFSDWLKGKGNVIIISVDERLACVFANLEEVFVSKGAQIKANDILGRIMPDSSGRRLLYFSTWLDGDPFDPSRIIKR